MNVFDKVKAARVLLGLSQVEASLQSGLKQKDISMLEAGHKKFIPEPYILFLYNQGIDINSVYDAGREVALIGKKYDDTPPATPRANEPNPGYSTFTPVAKSGGIDEVSQKVVHPTVHPTTILNPQIISADRSGKENILYINTKAAAGYLTGYSDRKYMETLPSFSLPGLNDASYRSFQVDGDSMYPTLENKEMVIGQWVEKLEYIREDRVHIVVTKNDGIIVKRLLNRVEKYGYVIAKSDAVDNRNVYPNIDLRPEDIVEIWYAVWHGSFNFKSPTEMYKRVNNMEADLYEVLRIMKENKLMP